MAGRRRPRREEPETPLSRSLPLRRGLPPLDYLDGAQVERIHAAALHILQHVGVVFRSPEALHLLRGAGARIEGERAYLDRVLLDPALAAAPARYTLHARNPAHSLVIGDDSSNIMPVGGAPLVVDLAGRRRPGTLADLADFTRLSAVAPQIHVVGRKTVEIQDVPPAVRHLLAWQTLLTLSDKPLQSGMPGGRAEAEDVLAMLAIVFGGLEALAERPVAHASVNANSPLLFDAPMIESLLLFARHGQPVVITPFVMAGVTGPATLAGSLAQAHAEVLAGVILAQLARPGAAVIYGSATANADLRNAHPASGSPESALFAAASAQLARFCGLPSRGGGALTDAHRPGQQSGQERMMTLLATVLAGTHFIMHGAGLLSSYLAASFEQFVIDLELIDMVRALVAGMVVDEDTLALEAIARVGPGGFFLDDPHTLRHYRSVHFLPQLGRRQSFEQWQEGGGEALAARAGVRCRQLLAAYEQPPLPAAVAAALHDYVERRCAELLG